MSNAFSFHWLLGFQNSVLCNLRPLERIYFSYHYALREVGGCASSPPPLSSQKFYGGTLLISLVIKTVPSFYALWSNVASYVGQLIAKISFIKGVSASTVCPAAFFSVEGV